MGGILFDDGWCWIWGMRKQDERGRRLKDICVILRRWGISRWSATGWDFGTEFWGEAETNENDHLSAWFPCWHAELMGFTPEKKKIYAKCKYCLLIRHFKIIKWYLEEFLYRISYWQIAVNAFYWSFQNEFYLNDFNIDLCNSKFLFLSCQSVIDWSYY